MIYTYSNDEAGMWVFIAHDDRDLRFHIAVPEQELVYFIRLPEEEVKRLRDTLQRWTGE